MTWLSLLAVLATLSACTLSSLTAPGLSSATGGDTSPASCPTQWQVPTCITPRGLRMAYGVESLYNHGDTGAGQTVLDIVSYGSPTLQADVDIFDAQFGLPPITVSVLAPLGTVPFDPTNPAMTGWAGETTLDVELIHAIAPAAPITVLTSPVDETEGTQGLPQFLQLEQYAVQHHLGRIISQSWTASEATLTDPESQALVQQFATFYQQIVTQQEDIVVNASGDNGATDCAVVACLDAQGNPDPSKFATTPTVGFPVDVPWVTAVGGTSLVQHGSGYVESAWNGSGGGVSRFFAEPAFQQDLPASDQELLKGQRGIPDVAADADPDTGMAFYCALASCGASGGWTLTGGTSAATPVWAAIFALADQMAGHPLGNVNPALYQLGAAAGSTDFRDVTVGDNTNQQAPVPVAGFSATPGWDLVTGWGAPQADTLLPALIAALS
jgi:subtilase family serine protease